MGSGLNWQRLLSSSRSSRKSVLGSSPGRKPSMVGLLALAWRKPLPEARNGTESAATNMQRRQEDFLQSSASAVSLPERGQPAVANSSRRTQCGHLTITISPRPTHPRTTCCGTIPRGISQPNQSSKNGNNVEETGVENVYRVEWIAPQ